MSVDKYENILADIRLRALSLGPVPFWINAAKDIESDIDRSLARLACNYVEASRSIDPEIAARLIDLQEKRIAYSIELADAYRDLGDAYAREAMSEDP